VHVAERVMEAVGGALVVEGHELTITPSVGIAFGGAATGGADELLRDADAAMYLAKDQGKGRTAIFEPGMHAAAMERLQLKGDLQRAVRDGELSLVYQPIVDLRDDVIVGVEALARWVHPVRGPVSPAEFVPLAEETGLIVELGRQLLLEACLHAAVLQEACPRPAPLSMSVNLSARQLQAPELIGHVRDALAASGIPASSLVLELTESAMIEDVELAIARLEALRDLGVSLAIDDFGTGYSSLTYIRRFPVDVLKIDRSFIDGVAGDSAETEALTASILQLAEILALKPVAEGIEDQAQLERLRELGCALGQGYHLHRPLSAEATVELLSADGRRAAATA